MVCYHLLFPYDKRTVDEVEKKSLYSVYINFSGAEESPQCSPMACVLAQQLPRGWGPTGPSKAKRCLNLAQHKRETQPAGRSACLEIRLSRISL